MGQMVIQFRQYIILENSEEIYYIGDNKMIFDSNLHKYHILRPYKKTAISMYNGSLLKFQILACAKITTFLWVFNVISSQ